MNWNALIKLEKNKILVESTGVSDSKAQYAFYLYHYQKQSQKKQAICKKNYIKKNRYSFKVSESGYYFVKCFLLIEGQKYIKDTVTVLYTNEQFIKKFDDLLRANLKTRNTINKAIEYFKVPAPQNDFCAIFSKKKIKYEKLRKWGVVNGYFLKVANTKWKLYNYILHSNDSTQAGLHKQDFIFSGYAFINNQTFYFDQSSIPENIIGEELYEKIGSYSLLDIDENKILLTTDMFGYSKLFYYKDNNTLIVSNKYHLLLITLKKLRIRTILDEDILFTTFASNVTMLRQTVTDKLIVKNTHMLNLCEEILVDENGWSFKKRDLYNILNEEPKFDNEKYQRLIAQGKNEIIKHIESIKNCGLFDEIIVDLSGGKDSRVNFAALLSIEGSKDDYTIYTAKHEPRDHEIAVGINNLYKYPFTTSKMKYIHNNILDYIAKKRSNFMGYHYLWYIPEKHSHDLSKIRLTGESFESFVVRYYSKTVEKFDLKDSDSMKIAEAYANMLSKQAVISFNDVNDIFISHLTEVLNNIPCETYLEAFDNLFLFYRGATHAGNLDFSYYGTAICVPAQSLALIKAKKMWFNNFKTEKVIFDLLDEMEPLLGRFPFNSDKNNDALKAAIPNLIHPEYHQNNSENVIDYDLEKWYNALLEKKRNSEEVFTYDEDSIDDVPTIVYQNCILAIQKLAKYRRGRYIDKICIPVYYYLEQEKMDQDEVRILHNKLNSTLDCIDLLY